MLEDMRQLVFLVVLVLLIGFVIGQEEIVRQEIEVNALGDGSSGVLFFSIGEISGIVKTIDGRRIISAEGYQAATTLGISVSDSRLFVLVGGSVQEISVLPKTAAMKGLSVSGSSCSSGCSVALVAEGGKAAYVVRTEDRAALLMLVPFTLKREALIDASSGAVLKVRKPIWGYVSVRR